MAKRGNGEGSIYKYKDGWRGQIVIGRDENGKQIRKTVSGKKKSEVQAKLAKIKENLEKEVSLNTESGTLDQWLLEWMNKYKKISIKEKTYESYMHNVENYLIPYLGHITLNDLKTIDVQGMINSMDANGLSPRTIRYAVVILNNSLDQAIKNGLINVNVAKAAVLPKQRKKAVRFLSKEQQIQFIEACKNDEGGLPFLFMLATGIRRGELLGLRWQDINFEESTVKIVQTVQRVKDFDNNENKTKLIIDTPKTSSSIRQIPISAGFKNELVAQKSRQEEQKDKIKELGLEYQDYDLVFASEMGTPIEPRNLNRKFYKMIEAAGIKDINLHGLRHSFATRLLEEKESAKVVQELLGHKSIQITLDIYSHVSDDLKKDAIQKIDKYF